MHPLHHLGKGHLAPVDAQSPPDPRLHKRQQPTDCPADGQAHSPKYSVVHVFNLWRFQSRTPSCPSQSVQPPVSVTKHTTRRCPFLPQMITSSQKDTVNESMVSHFNAERKQGIEVSGSVSGEARIRVIRGKPTTHNPLNTRKPLRGTLKTLNFEVPVHTFRVFCDGRRPFCVFCGQSPPIKGTRTTDGTDTRFARHGCTRLCERSALCGPHDLITRR